MVFMRFDPLRGPGRLADQANGGPCAPRTLPMEMLGRGDRLMVTIDVPGVDPKDVEVTVERNVVEIVGHRPSLQQEGDEVIVDERAHGEFRRQLFLGVDLDLGNMTAACERGVLTLTIPRSQASKPRKVEIDSADEGRQALRSGSKQHTTAKSSEVLRHRRGRGRGGSGTADALDRRQSTGVKHGNGSRH